MFMRATVISHTSTRQQTQCFGRRHSREQMLVAQGTCILTKLLLPTNKHFQWPKFSHNSFVKFCESLRSHPAWLLVVGSPLFRDCRLYTDSILTTALYIQCRFVQEDDVRKTKVENWTKFAPCCFCCGRYCSRARCAQFWRQLREMQHRLFLLLEREFSDGHRMLQRKVRNVSDIPSQCVSMPINLLHATNSNKMAGVQEWNTLWRDSTALGKRERAETFSNGSLAVLAPINVYEKGTEISVLVQDRKGCM